MDLLGSILNSMDGPPKVDEKQKQLLKGNENPRKCCLYLTTLSKMSVEQKEREEKARQFSKNEINRFQKYVEERIGRFVKDDRKSIQFPPLEKMYRAIV